MHPLLSSPGTNFGLGRIQPTEEHGMTLLKGLLGLTPAGDIHAIGQGIANKDMLGAGLGLLSLALPGTIKPIRRGGVKKNLDISNLPEVEEGYTRLYRASSPDVKFDDVFDRQKLAEQGIMPNLPGEHYTPDLDYADYFRETYGKSAKIEYVDVPTQSLAGKEAADGFVLDLKE